MLNRAEQNWPDTAEILNVCRTCGQAVDEDLVEGMCELCALDETQGELEVSNV